MIVDKHALAVVGIVGSSLDVLGTLYLAYDLLGGEDGPLRILSRIVTYGLLFGIGFGLALGPVFGLVCGVTHGITLGWELARAARHRTKGGVSFDIAMSALRGAGFAAGAAYLYGGTFGISFGVLSTVGQVLAYRIGIRPSLDYKSGTRPRMTKYQFIAVLNRTVGYTAAGYISALVAQQRTNAVSVGMNEGLVIGVVTAIVGSCSPFVEWIADHVPERAMGVFGVVLILVGFALQSVQYWLALLDVSVR